MEVSYTKEVQFYKKKRCCKNENFNMLFLTENTYKDIFNILENCWVYQQNCWVLQTIPFTSYGEAGVDSNIHLGPILGSV